MKLLSEWIGTRVLSQSQWPLYMKRFSLFSSLSNVHFIKEFFEFSSTLLSISLMVLVADINTKSINNIQYQLLSIKCAARSRISSHTQHIQRLAFLDNLRRYYLFSWLIYLKRSWLAKNSMKRKLKTSCRFFFICVYYVFSIMKFRDRQIEIFREKSYATNRWRIF